VLEDRVDDASRGVRPAQAPAAVAQVLQQGRLAERALEQAREAKRSLRRSWPGREP